MGNIVVAGPNEVVVVSGGCLGKESRYVAGGFAWKTWCVSRSERMSLEVMTLLPSVSSAEKKNGVPINVSAVAQVRIMRDKNKIKKACEQFLGKKPHEIEDIIVNTFAESIKAEAAVIEAIGKAEANQMLMKANAYREYGQAATTKLVLESLPKIAKAIAMPLEKIEDMTIVG